MMVLVRHRFQEYVVDEVFLLVGFKVLTNFCTNSLPALILQHTRLQKDIPLETDWLCRHIYLFIYACKVKFFLCMP